MTLYGDTTQVKKMLRPVETSTFGTDADSRLTELQEVVSLLIEEKTGRVFGGTATATARTIDGPPAGRGVVLALPCPVRSVTSVAIVGAISETLTAYDTGTGDGDYLLWNPGRQGDYHALRRVNGGQWPAGDGLTRITITAVWSDTASGGSVPDDITYMANYIISELFKAEQASPAGFTGPDGATVPIRNPWNQDLVKTTIRKYASARRIVGF